MEVAKRSKILSYIEATLTGGLTKKDAYLTHVDDKVKNPTAAVARLERSKEFQDIYHTLITDENYKFQESAQRVRSKYLGLIEKNIDTAGSMLDGADTTSEKAKAVRLTNETIQAMAIVANPTPADREGSKPINKSGVIS